MALTQTAKAYQSYTNSNKAATATSSGPAIVAGKGTVVSSSPPATPPVSTQSNSATPPETPTKTSYGPAATPSASSSGGTAGKTPAAVPTTNYGGKGNPYNEILYSKKQYDAGNKSWAANNAKQFYAQIDPTEASQIQKMNTQQLTDYINSKNSVGKFVNETPPVNTLPPGGMNGTPYVSGYTGPDTAGMTDQIKDIHDNSYAAQLQLLKQALQTRLQGLDTQAATAKQNAYETANQADATNLQNEQRMKETVANAGLRTDGQNLTLQAAQNASRMGALTDINNQRDAALNDIQGQRSVAQNNAAANELALRQGLDADQAKALLDLMYYGDDKAYQVDQSNYGRFADQRNFNYQSGQDQIQNDAQYAGSYNGGKTVGQTQQEWNNRFNYGNAIGQFGNGQQTVEKQQFEYGKTQDQIANNQWQQNFDRTKYESDRNYQFQKQQQSIQNGQWQQQFDVDIQKFGFDKATQMWSQAFQERQANQKNQPQPTTAEDMRTYFDSMAQRNKDGQITNPTDLENAIVNSELSDYDAYQMYLRYGLKWNGDVPKQSGN